MPRRGLARGVRPRRSVGEVRDVREARSGGFRPRGSGGRGGLGVLVAVIIVLLLFVFVVPPIFGGIARGMAEDNPDLLRLPFFADAVSEGMDERVDRPAGTDGTPVSFTIAPGTGAREITDELAARGLVADRLAFSYILITEGAGNRLRAGSYTLDRTMSPREIADALQRPADPTPPGVTVQFRAGLRIEQYTAQLVHERDRVGIDPRRFYELALDPPAEWLSEYPMLAGVPDGHSLEGFLGAGVFQLDLDADAEDLLRVLLDARQAEIGELTAHAVPQPLTSFYEVMILASIVEAEARLPEERPLIAGVFLNRLDRTKWSTRLLNADPTVIYGNDTMALDALPLDEWNQYLFWGPPGRSMSDVRLPDHMFGFQTYRSRGLPPWPIRSPTRSSIMGVLEPDTEQGYLYFVAKGDGSNSHAFASNEADHQRNVDIYVRGLGTPAP